MELNLLQEKKIKWLIVGFAALSGFIAVLVYLDQKKHNNVKEEIMGLDKEIKLLQLEKLKNGKA